MYRQEHGQPRVWVSVTAGRALSVTPLGKKLFQGNSRMKYMAFTSPYLGIFKARNLFPIVNPLAQLPGNTNIRLSVRDKITKTAPSSSNKQPMENWFQGRLPISLNSRKSAHIYAWLLKWTAWLLLLICSQRSILSVGTPGGSHAGTGQGKKKHPVDILNGTENSPTISVSLCPAMPCIDFSSSFLGHLQTSKPKPHHSSHFH